MSAGSDTDQTSIVWRSADSFESDEPPSPFTLWLGRQVWLLDIVLFVPLLSLLFWPNPDARGSVQLSEMDIVGLAVAGLVHLFLSALRRKRDASGRSPKLIQAAHAVLLMAVLGFVFDKTGLPSDVLWDAITVGLVLLAFVVIAPRYIAKRRASVVPKHGKAIALTEEELRFAAPNSHTSILAVPVTDILDITADYVVGSPALSLTLPGRTLAVVTADLAGLRAALLSLRPDLKATP